MLAVNPQITAILLDLCIDSCYPHDIPFTDVSGFLLLLACFGKIRSKD